MRSQIELESADSLISAVTSEEERQEARAQEALMAQTAAEQEASRRFVEQETRTEEQYLKAAGEELREYAENEPKAIVQAAHEGAKEKAATYAASAKKNAKKVTSDLLNQLLSLSFLSRP